MRHPIHEIWCDTYVDVIEEWRQRYGNGHLEIRKMKIKDANLFNTVGWFITFDVILQWCQNMCHFIFHVNFINITLIYHITKQRACETVSII
jgi:hypothetical protein